MPQPIEQDREVGLWPRWRAAAGDAVVDAALRGLYARLDSAIQERGPTCWLSGRCCNFDAFGHRLYVTGLETAWLLMRVSDVPRPDRVDPRGPCPFQIDKMCSVHALRPLGCRVFFCEEATQAWQHETYERFLTELRGLHDAHGLPYRYMEWRTALREGLCHLCPRERSAGPPAG